MWLLIATCLRVERCEICPCHACLGTLLVTYMSMYACVCVCVYIYIYIYIHIYICMNT